MVFAFSRDALMHSLMHSRTQSRTDRREYSMLPAALFNVGGEIKSIATTYSSQAAEINITVRNDFHNIKATSYYTSNSAQTSL